MISVLLVDDHKLMRTGIKFILDDTTDIRVVGEASSGEEGLERARVLKPNVILMDVSMPGIGGLEATRKLAMALPDTRIIVLSAHTAEPYPMRLMEAGAAGYITKDSAGDEIVTAIRRVQAGERYISAEIARQMALQSVNRTSSGSPFEQLSSREMQVMIMATGGHSVQDISDKLHLEPQDREHLPLAPVPEARRQQRRGVDPARHALRRDRGEARRRRHLSPAPGLVLIPMSTASFDSRCRLCPRLAGFLDEVRAEHPDYHAAPVAPFGDPKARFIVVGLAPGMHGANRSGRPFTGDHAGIILYKTLYKYGFASAPESVSVDDGLKLLDCRITNAVKCLPPANKPLPAEIRQCNSYLAAELQTSLPGSVFLALGRIAHEAVLRALALKPKDYVFRHGAEYTLAPGKSCWIPTIAAATTPRPGVSPLPCSRR